MRDRLCAVGHRHLLHLLVGTTRAGEPGATAEVERLFRRLSATPGFVGLGAADREVAGRRSSDPALKVYVVDKRARRALDGAAPAYVTHPVTGVRVDLDVEAVGRLSPQAGAAAGGRIQRQGVPGHFGTLGCLAEEVGGARRRFLVSNAHVLAPMDGGPRAGDVVEDGAGTAIAKLTAWTRFEPGLRATNTADVAIAEVLDGAEVSGEIPGLGLPTGRSDHVFARDRVFLRGATTTSLTRSVVTDDEAFLQADYRTASGAARFSFVKQVFCEPFTSGGDSGSVVLNRTGRIVGLHFWGSNKKSVFNLFSEALDAIAAVPAGVALEPVTEDRIVDLDRLARGRPANQLSRLDREIDGDPGGTSGTLRAGRPAAGDADDAVRILAQTIWAEAQGEGQKGMEAVAEVVINRLRSGNARRFGGTVEEVCLKPCQFSCWNDGTDEKCPNEDPMFRRIRNETEVPNPSSVFREALRIAERFVAGQTTRHTKGADHYHHKRLDPRWARGKTPCFMWMNHEFYNDIP